VKGMAQQSWTGEFKLPWREAGPPNHRTVPQKALRGVIPAPSAQFLEPFCGKLLSKYDKSDGN